MSAAATEQIPMNQLNQFILGTYLVPLDRIRFHAHQREENLEHVQVLRDSFSSSTLLRWAHPLHIVLSDPVRARWGPQNGGNLPPLPEGVQLYCVDGKHRVLAAKEFHKIHKEEEFGYWPAIVYDSRMNGQNWLRVFMLEKNTVRHRLPTSERQCLLGLDRLCRANPDIDVYGVVSKHWAEAKAIQSLHQSVLWKSFIKLIKLDFFDMRKEVYIQWPKRYSMYTFMAILLYDCVLQHRQIEERYGEGWTMEVVYGASYEKNQHLAKSGLKEEVNKQLRKRWKMFDLEDEEEFWQLVGRRQLTKNGGEAGDAFYFGEWLSNPHALATHRQTLFSQLLDDYERIVSLFQALSFPRDIHRPAQRRSKEKEQSHDWACVLSRCIGEDNDEVGKEVIVWIMTNRVELMEKELEGKVLPSLQILSDPTSLIRYLDMVDGSEAWQGLFDTFESRGFVYDREAILAAREVTVQVAATSKGKSKKPPEEVASKRGGKGKPKKPRQNSRPEVTDSQEEAAAGSLKRKASQELEREPRHSLGAGRMLEGFMTNPGFLSVCNRLYRRDPEILRNLLIRFQNTVTREVLQGEEAREFEEHLDEYEGPLFLSEQED